MYIVVSGYYSLPLAFLLDTWPTGLPSNSINCSQNMLYVLFFENYGMIDPEILEILLNKHAIDSITGKLL